MARAKKHRRRAAGGRSDVPSNVTPGGTRTGSGGTEAGRARGWSTVVLVAALVLDLLFLASVLARGVALDAAEVVSGEVVRVDTRGTGRHQRTDLAIVVPAGARCPAPLVEWTVHRATTPRDVIDIACTGTIAMPAAERLASTTRHVLAGLLLAVVASGFVTARAGARLPLRMVPRRAAIAIVATVATMVVHGIVASALADGTALGGFLWFLLGTVPTFVLVVGILIGLVSPPTAQPR